MPTATTDRRHINRAPYGIAQAAAHAAAFSYVLPSQAAEYIRRRAYLATRRACPHVTAATAYALARTAQAAAVRALAYTPAA